MKEVWTVMILLAPWFCTDLIPASKGKISIIVFKRVSKIKIFHHMSENIINLKKSKIRAKTDKKAQNFPKKKAKKD